MKFEKLMYQLRRSTAGDYVSDIKNGQPEKVLCLSTTLEPYRMQKEQIPNASPITDTLHYHLSKTSNIFRVDDLKFYWPFLTLL